ncbi:MAG: glycosyltransferase family 2 protein [Planctomycetota bacterium]
MDESEDDNNQGSLSSPASSKIAVLIVNWNGGDLTLDAIVAVGESRLLPAEIIVVDNGSTDGSLDRVRREHPGCHLIENQENLGFGTACNQGFELANSLAVDFVFLLNNDARLEPETLGELVKAAMRHESAGLFAGKILYPDGRLWCAGVDIGFFPNLQNLRGFGQKDRGQFDSEEVVDALTGCGLLIRSSLLKVLNGFDEQFFVYVEDIDLCARAHAAGFSAVYAPRARMTHLAGASSGGGYGAWRKRILAYNVVSYLKKHGSWRLWTSFALLDVLSWPFLLLLGGLRGRGPAVWAKGQGMFAGLLGLKSPGPPR